MLVHCMALPANTPKCDRAEPACNRCQKIGKICPGYRLESELLFKDQTEKTVARSRRRGESGKPSTSPPATLNSQHSPESQEDDGLNAGDDVFAERPRITPISCPQQVSTQSLSPFTGIPPHVANPLPPNDQAICIFMADYVQAPQNGWPQGHLEFLPSMLHNARSDSCLPRAVYAVAYRYLYNLIGQPSMQSHARYYYSQSLESIHEALEGPLERLYDSTLLAVWLVGLYEVRKRPIHLRSLVLAHTIDLPWCRQRGNGNVPRLDFPRSWHRSFTSASRQASV